MPSTKVTLRRRVITKGRETLYLDYYPAIRNPDTMEMSRREYLGIYIYQLPTNEIQREYNKEMIKKSEAIRSIRVQSLINEEYGFFDKHKRRADFLIYFQSIAKSKDQKWMIVYTHFNNFVISKCTFGDVTVDLSRKFREYLINGKKIKNNKLRISQNSAASYFSTFRALLKKAYLDKLIKENINDYLEKIEYKDVRKEFLTIDELNKLAKTPCNKPVLKSASLFSCLTGLRISDILKLDWSEIVVAPDNGYCMRLRTQKTETEASLPISDDTLELCGERKTGKVFKGLQRSMTQYPLKNWIKQAEIEKNITFHSFRHTFATLQVAEGTDIYTVSKMLTHKNVSTTQIYAEMGNPKKRESANRIKLK